MRPIAAVARALLFALAFAVVRTPLAAQVTPDCQSGCLGGVEVTPDGGTDQHLVNSGPWTVVFDVLNTSASTKTFTFSCSTTGGMSCVSVNPTSASIKPDFDKLVTVTYNVGSTSGNVWLTATATGSSDDGYFVITATVPQVTPTGPVVARELCLTIAAGPSAAYECGDLRMVHPLPSVRTLGKLRTPTLLYNSQNAYPFPSLNADLTLGVNDRPDSIVAIASLKIGGSFVQRDRRAWAGAQWGTPSQAATRRVMTNFAASDLATGFYAFRLELDRFVTGVGYTAIRTDTGTVAIVNRFSSPFGAGWWLAGFEQIQFPADGSILWIGGDGSVRRYVNAGSWSGKTWYVARPMDGPDTLSFDGTGTYTRFLKGGTKVLFNTSGFHTQTVNRLGYATVFAPDGSNRLSTITLPPSGSGRTYTFTYAGPNGTLSSVSSPDTAGGNGRVTTINGSALTAGARISTITDPGIPSSVQFVYGNGSYPAAITGRTDRRGTTTGYALGTGLKLVADSLPVPGAQTIRQTFCPAEVRVWACGSGLTAPESTYTVYDGPRTDSADVTHFWLDSLGAVTQIRDAYNNLTTIARTDARWPILATRIHSPNGRTIGATYDARGNLATSTDSSLYAPGQHATTLYQWDPLWDEVTQITLPTGEVTQLGYDATNGNRLWQQDGRGTASRVNFAYYSSGAAGLLKTVTDALGSKDSLAYDGLDNLSLTRTALGYQATIVSDLIGRQTVVRSQVGTVTHDDSTYYDQLGRIIRTASYGPAVGGSPSSPAGKVVVRNFYNAESALDSLQRWSEPDDSALVGTVTNRWRYDLAGRRVTEVAPDLAKDSTVYDPAGNPVTVVTRRGDTLRMSYDRMNRLKRRIIPGVTYAPILELGIAAQDIRGCHIPYPRYVADSNNDQCFNPAPDSSLRIPGDTALLTYDLMGNLIAADNADAQIRRTYFNDGRVKTDTLRIRTYLNSDFSQHIYGITYRYDLSGRLVVLKHPHQLAPHVGTSVPDSVRYAYNALTGLLETVTDPLGDVFTHTYNNRNDRIRLDLPGGISEHLGFDADARLQADTVLNNSTSAYKNPDPTLRRLRLHYADPERVDSALNSVGWKDTTVDTFDGLGHLVQLQTFAPGGTNFPLPTRLYSTEVSRFDALGNAYYSTHSSDVQTTQSHEVNYGDRFLRFAPLAGGLPTGRLRANNDATRIDSTWYDAAGNTRFRYQIWSTSTATLEDQVSWYGADGQLRAAEFRSFPKSLNGGAEAYTTVFEQYRYDALGRRVLVRTRKDCKLGEMSPVSWCSLGTIRRTVWDGQAELYEIQMLGNEAHLTDGFALENDTLPWSPITTSYPTVWDGDRMFGRVAYTYGGDLDRPLSMVRIAYGDTVWNGPFHWWPAFAIVPHWNWRGEADYGTLAGLGSNDGGIKTCWPGEPSRCISPRWQPKLFAIARQFADTMTWQWLGSLLEGKEDGTGLQYRRNRYVDPVTGRFTQEDPLGLAGGLNLYGFAGGDPVNSSDPFGLCPGIAGTDQNSVDDCPAESSRSFWDRLWNGRRYVEFDGRRYPLLRMEVPFVSPGGAERSVATLARHTSKFVNAVNSLDASHLAIAARELAGEITGFDHVTEVRNSMNAMGKIIRSMTGFLKNPNLTAELRAGAEQLLEHAQEALRRAQEIMR